MLCAALSAQTALLPSPSQTSAPAQPPQTLTTNTTLVLVPALVRSNAGKLVYTLTAQDFILTDDGIPQKLTLEQDTGGESLALVVLIETGGAGAREFNKFDSIAPPLAPMLESIIGNVSHKVAVVTFDSQPTLLQPFTSNTNTAADALRTLTPGCTRQHHLDDCASPLAIHNVALGDNGAAILDSARLRRRPPAQSAPGVSPRHSSHQRNSRPRQPSHSRTSFTRHQRHQHHHLQHWVLHGKIRSRPLRLPRTPNPARRSMDGKSPPQSSRRLHEQRRSRPRSRRDP